MSLSEVKDFKKVHETKEAFLAFVNLVSIMEKYDFCATSDNLEELLLTVKMDRYSYPLPSGNYGNALAVAIELQLYPSALTIIENSEALGIDLNNVLVTKENTSAQTLFNYSLTHFNMTITPEQEQDLSSLPNALRRIKNNILAASDIQEELKGKANKR